MTPILDQEGTPSKIRIQLWSVDSLEESAGHLSPATQQAAPLLELDARPAVLLAHLLVDAGFALARRCPELAGQNLPVALEFDGPKRPAVPMLVVRDSRDSRPWPERSELLRLPIVLRSLDLSCLAGPVARHDLDPARLAFSLTTAPNGGKPGHETPLVRVRGSRAPELLSVQVPAFTNGEAPTPWRELSPALAQLESTRAVLPVHLPEPLLQSLVADEARFSEQVGLAWKERCWFLTGEIFRTGGDLASVIRQARPALHCRAGPDFLEFTSRTWAEIRAEIRRDDEQLLGWAHPHSVRALARRAEELSRQDETTPSPGSPLSGKTLPPGAGLFLSTDDLRSARDRGFRTPWMITMVIDSDCCGQRETDASAALEQQVGVWGWQNGLLYRRSIRLTEKGDNP